MWTFVEILYFGRWATRMYLGHVLGFLIYLVDDLSKESVKQRMMDYLAFNHDL